jgi:hypothetical protein
VCADKDKQSQEKYIRSVSAELWSFEMYVFVSVVSCFDALRGNSFGQIKNPAMTSITGFFLMVPEERLELSRKNPTASETATFTSFAIRAAFKKKKLLRALSFCADEGTRTPTP